MRSSEERERAVEILHEAAECVKLNPPWGPYLLVSHLLGQHDADGASGLGFDGVEELGLGWWTWMRMRRRNGGQGG